MLKYSIGTSGQLVCFSQQVLDRFWSFRQTHWLSKEAGGQLFASFSDDVLMIENATGPRKTDVRSRTSYIPDIKACQLEIEQHFEQGLQFIGNWHTHPENIPLPSELDLITMSKCFQTAEYSMFRGFILVVVGRNTFPSGLHVSLHNGSLNYVLNSDYNPE